MATALARGFIHAGLVSTADLIGSDPDGLARTAFSRETGATSSASNVDVIRRATVIVLAVKPGQVDGVLGEINSAWTPAHLLVSIAAGVTLTRLESALPGKARVVRVMPNAPAFVGKSASAYSPGTTCQPQDAELTQRLFSSVGLAFALRESLLDAVTGLSGSGPAYAFLMIEALSDGGVAAGLPRDVATCLAAQTLLGSATLLLETGLHPGALKDMVTSPGGTTIEGLRKLEEAGVRGALINAVVAAAEKSKMLGQG
jgi:pyrroline-5-carboxylate reductase